MGLTRLPQLLVKAMSQRGLKRLTQPQPPTTRLQMTILPMTTRLRTMIRLAQQLLAHRCHLIWIWALVPATFSYTGFQGLLDERHARNLSAWTLSWEDWPGGASERSG